MFRCCDLVYSLEMGIKRVPNPKNNKRRKTAVFSLSVHVISNSQSQLLQRQRRRLPPVSLSLCILHGSPKTLRERSKSFTSTSMLLLSIRRLFLIKRRIILLFFPLMFICKTVLLSIHPLFCWWFFILSTFLKQTKNSIFELDTFVFLCRKEWMNTFEALFSSIWAWLC